MIVTTDKDPEFGHVVLQKDHTELAHQLACQFGNAAFEGLDPKDLMEFVALNHDRGWDLIDSDMPHNPKTGLPYCLDRTPVDRLLRTLPQSAVFNARHHPYCGLLACMHIWGLYHGRYGLTDEIAINALNGDEKVRTEAMLTGIAALMDELRGRLASDAATRHLLESRKLMQNYKVLQLFDRLSLYFNFRVGLEGEPVAFHHVPRSLDADTTVHVTPLGRLTYALQPYPFAERELQLHLRSYRVRRREQAGPGHGGPLSRVERAEVETITLVGQSIFN